MSVGGGEIMHCPHISLTESQNISKHQESRALGEPEESRKPSCVEDRKQESDHCISGTARMVWFLPWQDSPK